MTYDEFWTGNHARVIAYRKAHYKRIEEQNQAMWLQGLYFYDAIGAVFGSAFAKKGSAKPKYMENPIKILPKTGYELKKEQEKERQKAINALTAWADTWAIRHK